MNENEISHEIVGAAIEVHRLLGGPGLLEDVYEECLGCELGLRGMTVARQVPVPVVYKGQAVKRPLVMDMLVGNLVIVEVKAVEMYNPVFEAQVLTYLRLTGLKLGLVLNFGEILLKKGVHRVANGL